jgi:hypothetical protein
MATFWRAFPHDGKISPDWDASPWGEPPFTISIITYKVVIYAAVEWADTLPQFLLYPFMNSVITTKKSVLESES